MDNLAIREDLVQLLNGHQAHIDFDAATNGLPVGLRGAKPHGLSHTPWQLAEHLRIAQRDIVDYCTNPAYVPLIWPEEYWPASEAPPDDLAWDRCLKALRDDLQALKSLVTNPDVDLFARIAWGGDHTIFRELLLVADHNSYHLGQFVIIRKLLDMGKG